MKIYLLSNLLKEENSNNPNEIRRLYSLVQRAAVGGDIKALKLLSKHTITSSKGTPRSVADYGIAEQDLPAVREWLAQQSRPRSGLLTPQQAEQLTADQFQELIEKQQKGTKPKRKRKAKTKRAAGQEQQLPQQEQEGING